MAFDAAQILRQTYAAGIQAAAMHEMAEAKDVAPMAERGEIMGSAFTVEIDPIAELMDSMEELSFQFEEKESKRVSERKLGQMQGAQAALMKALQTWSAMLPDMPSKEFLEYILRNLRNAFASKTPIDARELLKELSRGTTDPSHQFAMLDILEQALGQGEENIRELVRQAKSILSSERGPDIRAGINLAEEVNARATTSEEMRDLRDMYRREVVGFEKPQDCFRSILSTRGADGVKAAIEFLIAGCAADLESSAPSLEMAALGRILTDLQCVQVLQTVLEALIALGKRMDKQFGEHCLLDGEGMAGRVLDMTEQPFVTASLISSFVGECGMRRLLAKMDFTRELTSLFRKLSPRLFAKEGDRQRLVDAAQEHLDNLVSQEMDEATQGGAA